MSKKPTTTKPTISKPTNSTRAKKPAPAFKIKLKIAKPVAESSQENELNDEALAPLVSKGEPESGPPDSDESDGDSVGVPYVRLLNQINLIRPVDVEHVADRLCEGYHFIEDEPSVPRVLGNCDLPDGASDPGFTLRAVPMNRPNNTVEALQVWLRRMIADQTNFEGHKQLRWKYVATVRQMIAKERELLE